MNRCLPAFVALPALFVAAPALAAPPGVGSHSAEKMADVLQKWTDTVKNLRLQTEMTWEHEVYSSQARSEQGHDYRSGFDWTWSNNGKYRFYEWKRDRGKYVSDRLVTFDGFHYYTLKDPKGDPPTNLEDVSRHKPMTAVDRNPMSPLALLSRLNGTRREPHTISELLRDTYRNYGRYELKEDRGSVRMTITRPRVTYPEGMHRSHRQRGPAAPPTRKPPTPQSSRETVHITLDPDHGYFPRVVEKDGTRQVVTDFRLLKNLGIWIPTKGSFTIWSQGKVHYRHSWQVKDVKVNQELEEAYFQPPIPEGTPVKEGDTVVPYEDPIRKARELAAKQRLQFWLAWIVGLVIAAVAGWMCFRIWRTTQAAQAVD